MASPKHGRLAVVAKEMLTQIKNGQCDQAMVRADELFAATAAAVGKLGDSVKEISDAFASLQKGDVAKIRLRGSTTDAVFTEYRIQLQGAAATAALVSEKMKVLAASPSAKKTACDEVAKQLAQVR